MNFIYDVLLNFSNEEILDIYEWEKRDNISHVRKVPLFKIRNNQFKELISNNIVISKELCNEIYNKCEVISNKKIKKKPYIALFTDSKNVLAINFNELGKSISRSFLLYDEETEVIQFSDHIEYSNIDYQIISKYHKELLTRKEIIKIKQLKKDLISLFYNHEYDVLMYYYYECFNQDNSNIEEIYNKLIYIIDNSEYEKINIMYQINELIKTKD